jgi:RNA polymerase sigma-70 factor (ECF subfamily)
MERYARGDESAFSELYDALAPRLHGYLLRGCRDACRADDLLQQTMLQIHRARGSFIPGADVLPWAFAIARRLLIDSLRRSKHERHAVSLETGGYENGALEFDADLRPADELVDSQRLARAVHAALARLPKSQRVAFELIKRDGLSIREAAQALGATPTAVKLRVHRAYVALRSALRHVVDRR